MLSRASLLSVLALVALFTSSLTWAIPADAQDTVAVTEEVEVEVTTSVPEDTSMNAPSSAPAAGSPVFPFFEKPKVSKVSKVIEVGGTRAFCAIRENGPLTVIDTSGGRSLFLSVGEAKKADSLDKDYIDKSFATPRPCRSISDKATWLMDSKGDVPYARVEVHDGGKVTQLESDVGIPKEAFNATCVDISSTDPSGMALSCFYPTGQDGVYAAIARFTVKPSQDKSVSWFSKPVEHPTAGTAFAFNCFEAKGTPMCVIQSSINSKQCLIAEASKKVGADTSPFVWKPLLKPDMDDATSCGLPVSVPKSFTGVPFDARIYKRGPSIWTKSKTLETLQYTELRDGNWLPWANVPEEWGFSSLPVDVVVWRKDGKVVVDHFFLNKGARYSISMVRHELN